MKERRTNMSERTYKISAESVAEGVLLRIGFGRAAQNAEIVRDATLALGELKL
ncbi:hypothetical protein GF380_03050, partial [Candidatus Uhrbacteria bacterium]|nr:hypothetical protein [Candidatus Uhrbacteria bacterium]